MTDSLDTPPTKAGRREWIGLAVLALPALLLSLDLSIVYLALPSIAADLGASAVGQLWITDIYGFMVAGFLVTMGRLGDRIGRRRLLLIGGVAFALASVLAAFAPTVEVLVLARALMGVAGATLAPSVLALLTTMFRDPRERGTAVAVYVSCFMGGTALGPVVGGVLLGWFWWGSVFLLAVPVMIVLVVLTPTLVPEYRSPSASPVDLLSVLLSLGAILPLTLGIKDIVRLGPTPLDLTALAVGLVAGVLFVLRQRRLEHPLLDVGLFRIPSFRTALLALTVAVAAQGGVMLLVTQHYQLVEGFSPLVAGLWGIPASLAMVLGSLAAPAAAARWYPGAVMSAGLVLAGVGYVVLTRVGPVGALPILVIGASVVFLGTGFVGALGNDAIVGSVGPDEAGSAAAIAQTGGDLGISAGIAVFGSIAGATYVAGVAGTAAGLPPAAAGAVTESLAGARAAVGSLPTELGTPVLDAARSAFSDGLGVAAGTAAVLVVVLGALTAFVLRRPDDGVAAEAGDDRALESSR